MPAVQTSYPGAHVAAYPGLVANQELHNIVSRVVSVNPLAFGVLAFRGAGDDEVQPVAANAVFLGVTVVSPQVPADDGNQYAVGRNAAVLTKGVPWVTAAVAVSAGQPAYYDANGNITNVSAGNTQIPNCTFDSSTTAANAIVKLRLG
jgi:hypothetical protein